MKIGIIGLGVVGEALRYGFDHVGFDVTTHDIKYNTQTSDLLPCEIVYICVPTPQAVDGECDTSIVESCVDELMSLNYSGVVAIKSTVAPGTTQKLIDRYQNQKIVFVPEFLKERSANFDFLHDHNLLVVGSNDILIGDVVIRSHNGIAEDFVRLNPTEAELLKYMHNSFGALRVVFANLFYELSQEYGIDYTAVKNALVKKNDLPDVYLDVNDQLRGYSGVCFPKDMLALKTILEEKDIKFDLINAAINDNEKLKKTVFTGMRNE